MQRRLDRIYPKQVHTDGKMIYQRNTEELTPNMTGKDKVDTLYFLGSCVPRGILYNVRTAYHFDLYGHCER